MMPTLFNILRWVHVLAMISLLGGLLFFQVSLPLAQRTGPVLQSAVRLWNILLGIGFLAGVLLYLLSRGYELGPHYNGVVGLKFLILVTVGALLPLSRRSNRGEALRWSAIALLIFASFTAITL